MAGMAPPVIHWGFGEGAWPLAVSAALFVALSAVVALRRTGGES